MRIHIDKKGSWQTGQVGTPLTPLQVIVQDDEGIPAHKLEVRFRLVQGKGRFIHRDTETNAAGGAVAEFMPEAAGPYRIDCLVGGRGGRQTQFIGSIVEAVSAPAEEAPATDPATTADPQPPAAGVALFEEEIEKFVQAEVAGPDPIDETAAVEPMVTTDTAGPTADPPDDVPPPPAAVDPDSVDAYLDSLLQPAETPARPEAVGAETASGEVRTDAQTAADNGATAVATEAATEPEPTVIVDESALAPEPAASQPDTASAEPAQPLPEADEAPQAPDQTPEAEPTLASEPEQQAPERLRRLSRNSKIGLVLLALGAAVILLLCLVVPMSGTRKPAAPALVPGTIDCTGSTIKAVGQTYVFEGCRKVP